jgi:DNA-directed RNA polymerase sigma subunit (sigma70/sigma32)
MKRICKDQNLADLHPEIQRIWNTRKKEPETQVFDWGMDLEEPLDLEEAVDAHKIVTKAMADLSDRVTLVLTCRYWLDMTLLEVATDLSVSPERIRQLERVGRMIMRKRIWLAKQKEEVERAGIKRNYEIWRTQQNPRRIRVSTP